MKLESLKIGDQLRGGKFAGLITLPDGRHVAVSLLPNKPGNLLAWDEAMAWARKVGGELPSRLISAMMCENLESEYDEYWTRESCSWDAWYAWVFTSDMHILRKVDTANARAVLLTPIGLLE